MKKIVSIVLVLLFVCGLYGCATDTSNNNSSTTTSQEKQGQVLLDNDIVKVTFVEIFEEPSIPSTCYLRLKVENKTEETITVYPKDAYANDSAVTICSGVPMTLASGKNSQTPFFFTYVNLDITSISEIKTIEFKLWIENAAYETLLETDNLTINIQ